MLVVFSAGCGGARLGGAKFSIVKAKRNRDTPKEAHKYVSDFPFTFHFHALEKEIATHPSVLAWRIPGTRKPGGLPSLGLHRVRHD